MAFKSGTIDPKTINPPQISMTKRARDQWHLIRECDFTLEESVFRLEIAGKDCAGFTYAAGFTPDRPDDFKVAVLNDSQIVVHLDPFAAYYLQEVSIDFIQDFEQDAEGFVIINLEQEKFQGKFWKAAPELIPPLTTES